MMTSKIRSRGTAENHGGDTIANAVGAGVLPCRFDCSRIDIEGKDAVRSRPHSRKGEDPRSGSNFRHPHSEQIKA